MRLILPCTLLFLAACAEGTNNHAPMGDSTSRSTRDVDGDGYSEYTGDCDETSATAIYIHPGATELCDTVDNDCDGDIDDADSVHVDNIWAKDSDGDGFNNDYGKTMACSITTQEEFVEANGGELSDDYEQLTSADYADLDGDGDADDINWDCDDDDSTVYPGASEVCDGQFNDCDTETSWTSAAEASMLSTVYADSDGDTYGDASSSTSACLSSVGWVANDDDCDDTNAAINPVATEVCDEVDNDCDSSIDEGVTTTFYVDADGDGQGSSVTAAACLAPPGYVVSSTDCDDTSSSIYLGAPETCADDTIDNDCDGSTSDTPIDEVTRYRDVDGDSYGQTSSTRTSCVAPSGFATLGGDCDDADAGVNPGAVEVCDLLDNDCDTSIDESGGDLEIQILEGAGEAISITGVVSDDTSLSGNYITGVAGVTVVDTDLGADEWEYLLQMDLCISAAGTIVLDGEFESGESLADDPIANVYADVDGTELDVSMYSNGDGTFSYQIAR